MVHALGGGRSVVPGDTAAPCALWVLCLGFAELGGEVRGSKTGVVRQGEGIQPFRSITTQQSALLKTPACGELVVL